MKGTNPASGAVVKHLPGTVKIRFQAVVGGVRSVTVRDATGRDHAVRARLDPRNAARILVTTKRDVVSRYTVTWSIVAADGHRLTGSIRFRVRR